VSTYTAADAARAIQHSGMRGLSLRQLIDTQHGSGIVLSERAGHPVLGFGVVDSNGEAAVLALTADEAEELRSALADWLEEHRA
jgi:hypothetical protein